MADAIALPRVLVAATASGGGKTTVTCGLLQALLNRGLRPASFKCGPDYIDPMFHRSVLGVPGHNLDLFFTAKDIVRGLLADGAAGCDIAVLEGVMGYYDGAGTGDDRASSRHLADATETPVVLVVDAKGASLSLAALVHGFCTFRAPTRIRGVILNRCSAAFCEKIAPAIARECGVPVLGCLPADDAFAIPSRHLGLVTAAEVEGLRERMARIAARMEESVDIGALLAVARSAPPLAGALPALQKGAPVRIAVARDEAFCFYYAENLSMLERLGAELCFFSPLRGAALPAGTCALYLGGGYPELHAKTLAANAQMRACVKAAAAGGMPVLAECGGFLYLLQQLCDAAGTPHPMAGVLPGRAENTGALRRFGYVELRAGRGNLLCEAGDALCAHEFHHWDSTNNGDAFTAQKAAEKIFARQNDAPAVAGWRCIHANDTMFAGFPHLYFWANPAAAQRFVQAARTYAARLPDAAE